MAKQGSTKSKILKLIAKGENTLSAISSALKLAPSTVSKHLEDLQSIGAIEQLESQHIKKWKYYKVVTDPQKNILDSSINQKIRVFQLPLVGLLIVIFGIIAYFSLQNSSSATYLPISITDPPEIPIGTQALYLNYSSISLNISYGGAYAWVQINASGRIDLMSLINQSQVIAAVSLGQNPQISAVRFNVTSSQIQIDNLTYPVLITSKQVTAQIEPRAINSSSGLLLDFFPVVSTMYSANNSTTFAMVPSLRAVMAPEPYLIAKGGAVNRTSQPTFAFGTQMRYPLPPPFRGMFERADANITISKAFLHSYKNNTSFGFSLTNIGKRGAILRGLMLYSENKTPMNLSSVSGNWIEERIRFERSHPIGIGFFINSNQTLSLPSPPFEIPSYFGQGYYLLPNSTENFTYHKSFVGFPLMSNGTYKVAIISDSGIVAEQNVTID